MEQLMSFLSNPQVLTVLGLVVGAILKWVPWFNNKLIPVVNFLIALLVHAGAGIVLPTHAAFPGAQLASGVVLAGMAPFFSELWDALIQTAITTGLHSMYKNTKQYRGATA